jgi:hypothetical protein
MVSSFSKFQVEEKKDIKINNLNFLHYNAIITPSDYSKRMLTYMYSGKEGSLVFNIKTQVELSKENAEKISALLEGFSFDGKACRGNPALRSAKTFVESFTQ